MPCPTGSVVLRQLSMDSADATRGHQHGPFPFPHPSATPQDRRLRYWDAATQGGFSAPHGSNSVSAPPTPTAGGRTGLCSSSASSSSLVHHSSLTPVFPPSPTSNSPSPGDLPCLQHRFSSKSAHPPSLRTVQSDPSPCTNVLTRVSSGEQIAAATAGAAAVGGIKLDSSDVSSNGKNSNGPCHGNSSSISSWSSNNSCNGHSNSNVRVCHQCTSGSTTGASHGATTCQQGGVRRLGRPPLRAGAENIFNWAARTRIASKALPPPLPSSS